LKRKSNFCLKKDLEKKENTNYQCQIGEREIIYRPYRRKKDVKGILLTTLFHYFDNPDEMSEFLGREHVAKLTQAEIEILNSPVSIQNIEFVIKNLSTKKIPGPVVSLVISFKHLRKNSTNLT